MSKNLIILQHSPIVTAGNFLKFMKQDNFNIKIVRLDRNEKIPKNLNYFDGMICLGGPMDTWMEEKYSWMIEEKKKNKRFCFK